MGKVQKRISRFVNIIVNILISFLEKIRTPSPFFTAPECAHPLNFCLFELKLKKILNSLEKLHFYSTILK